MKLLSRVRLFVIPWTVAYQAPLSMGFSRQEYWSGFPFPSPGDLPNPGIEPRSPALQEDILIHTYKYIYNGPQWNLYLTKVQIKWIGECHILWKFSCSSNLDIIYTWSRMLWLEVEKNVLPMKMINSSKLRAFEKNKTSGWIETTLEEFTSRVMEIIWGHGTLTMMKQNESLKVRRGYLSLKSVKRCGWLWVV